MKGLAILAACLPHLTENRYITYYLLLITYQKNPSNLNERDESC